jgi:hypothetical protein
MAKINDAGELLRNVAMVKEGKLDQQERDILKSILLRFGRAFGISK